jgi:hypothetical protein
LPWQAQVENAAASATAKDLAEALYGIVAKHPEPEDVLYAMMTMHPQGCVKRFQASAAGVRCDVGTEDSAGGKGADFSVAKALRKSCCQIWRCSPPDALAADDVRLVFVVDHGQEREAARTPFLPSDVFLRQLV